MALRVKALGKVTALKRYRDRRWRIIKPINVQKMTVRLIESLTEQDLTCVNVQSVNEASQPSWSLLSWPSADMAWQIEGN